jgi:hypothetical protein
VSGLRAETTSSRGHPAGLRLRQRAHPAHIPQEVAGNPRPYPAIPPRRRAKSPALAEIPAYSGHPGDTKTGLSRRRSRGRVPSLPSKCLQMTCFVVRSDVKIGLATQTRVRRGLKSTETARARVGGPRFQAVFGRVETDREPGLRPHKMAGGQGPRDEETPARPEDERVDHQPCARR